MVHRTAYCPAHDREVPVLLRQVRLQWGPAAPPCHRRFPVPGLPRALHGGHVSAHGSPGDARGTSPPPGARKALPRLQPAPPRRVPPAAQGSAIIEPPDVSDPQYYHRVVDYQWGCPAHTNVTRYILMIANGRYSDANMLNRASNVFPGILGRTCDRPCAPVCRGTRLDG